MPKDERLVTHAGLVELQGRKLGEFDDYLVHQVPDTLDAMGYGAREQAWCEHTWIGLLPPEPGKPFVANLFSVRPNEGFMHCFSLACLGDKQYNFRGCRELNHDRASTAVGPFSLSTVVPYRKQTLTLEELPDSQFSYAATLERAADPQLWPMWEFQEAGEPFLSRWVHTTHAQRCTSGQIKLAGQTFSMDGYTGVKDHCWGVRGYKLGIFLHTWEYIFFPEYVIELMYREDQDGKVTQDTGQIVWQDGRVEWLAKQDLDIAFERGTRHFIRARWILTDSNGKKRELVAHRYYPGVYWIGGWSGENPNDYRGPLRFEHDVWDLTREKQIEEGKQTKEQLCRFTLDGQEGIGVFEYAVSKRHARYGASL